MYLCFIRLFCRSLTETGTAAPCGGRKPTGTLPQQKYLRSAQGWGNAGSPSSHCPPHRRPPGASPPQPALVLFSNFNSFSVLDVPNDTEYIFLSEVFSSALENLKKKNTKKTQKTTSHCNFRAGEVQNPKRPFTKANFLRLLSEEKCPRATAGGETRPGSETQRGIERGRGRRALRGKEAVWGRLSRSQCHVLAVHSQDN